MDLHIDLAADLNDEDDRDSAGPRWPKPVSLPISVLG